MRRRFFIIVLGLMAVGSATTLAQQGFVPARQGVRSWQTLLPSGRASDARIIGNVLDVDRHPVPHARVQLRDLVTGTVEREGSTNENGEYEFTVLDPSTFVVEMVAPGGSIVGVSNAGPVGRSETLRTTVQLSGRWEAGRSMVVLPQNVADYFGMSAQTTMTAGTLRIATELQLSPTDAGEPVSPNF